MFIRVLSESYIEYILNETNTFISMPMQCINLIFKVNNCHHRFIQSVEVEKQPLQPIKNKKSRREGDEDSEISKSDEVDTGAECIALIPTRSYISIYFGDTKQLGQ